MMRTFSTHQFGARALRFAGVAMALALTFALGGCSLQEANETADENAAANRQFIAQLNNRTAGLADVLSEFQAAVSETDAVGMKAASSKAGKIIAEVEAMEAPKPDEGARTADSSEELNNVKDLYAQGMNELNTVMSDYADLYSEVAAGTVTEQALARRLASLQGSYDHALEDLEKADDLLADLGKYNRTPSSSSTDEADSSHMESSAGSEDASAASGDADGMEAASSASSAA